MRSLHRDRTPVHALLIAAIQHVPAPAFLVASSGRVVSANPAGRSWLAATPGGQAALGRRDGPDPRLFCVTTSRRSGAVFSLAVLHTEPTGVPATSAPAEWKLTPREHEVTTLIAHGLGNHEIASELHCALRTVEQHVTNILRKADVVSRAALIVSLIARGQSSPLPHS